MLSAGSWIIGTCAAPQGSFHRFDRKIRIARFGDCNYPSDGILNISCRFENTQMKELAMTSPQSGLSVSAPETYREKLFNLLAGRTRWRCWGIQPPPWPILWPDIRRKSCARGHF